MIHTVTYFSVVASCFSMPFRPSLTFSITTAKALSPVIKEEKENIKKHVYTSTMSSSGDTTKILMRFNWQDANQQPFKNEDVDQYNISKLASVFLSKQVYCHCEIFLTVIFSIWMTTDIPNKDFAWRQCLEIEAETNSEMTYSGQNCRQTVKKSSKSFEWDLNLKQLQVNPAPIPINSFLRKRDNVKLHLTISFYHIS